MCRPSLWFARLFYVENTVFEQMQFPRISDQIMFNTRSKKCITVKGQLTKYPKAKAQACLQKRWRPGHYI
jgi:hypothetical protein